MSFKVDRTKRVAAQIQRELGQLLMQKVQDPRFCHVVVTHVALKPDFKQADIFVTSSVAEDKKSLLTALNKAAPYFRCLLAGTITLRSTPKLIFFDDDCIKRLPSVVVDQLIQTLA